MPEESNPDWSEQLGLVVERAGERFVDLLEAQAADNKLKIAKLCEPDKRTLERLFQEVVSGHVVAEAMAIVAALVYRQTGDDRWLRGTVPCLLDRFQQKMALTESATAAKTAGLHALAAKALADGAARDPAINSLLEDLVRSPPPGGMRATFDAVALSLLGE